MSDPAIDRILSILTFYQDHPIPGHPFVDIFPIFRDPEATEAVVAHLVDHIRSRHDLSDITSIVCLEARGFYIAPMVAFRLGVACIPVRKQGKLPGETVAISYAKAYEPDVFEIKTDAFHGVPPGQVILIDDLLAGGGSATAAKKLVQKMGREVIECVFIFAIPWEAEKVKEAMEGTPTYAMIDLTSENIAKLPPGR
ncbi:MAG: adenine phosphoribosyltransferase [Claussenomyces sp. TS43310]|nr:MAG: adenine phosphoribosyltransferase [Claussenomyces sp. TS43310]